MIQILSILFLLSNRPQRLNALGFPKKFFMHQLIGLTEVALTFLRIFLGSNFAILRFFGCRVLNTKYQGFVIQSGKIILYTNPNRTRATGIEAHLLLIG